MFDKMKALFDMQKKMKEIKQELDNTEFEASSSNGLVKITMNGSQEMRGIVIQADLKQIEKNVLEQAVKDAYNKAIKRAHEIAAQKMKDVTGFNLPGLT